MVLRTLSEILTPPSLVNVSQTRVNRQRDVLKFERIA